MRSSLLKAQLRAKRVARIACMYYPSAAIPAERHNIASGRPAGGSQDIGRMSGKGPRPIAHGGEFGALITMLPAFGRTFNDAGV